MTDLKPGTTISFQYIDRIVNTKTLPPEITYEAKNYTGKVLQVRDIELEGLSRHALKRNPSLERSQYLLTVRFPDNKIKSFYSGRMVNLTQIKPKSFIRRLIGV